MAESVAYEMRACFENSIVHGFTGPIITILSYDSGKRPQGIMYSYLVALSLHYIQQAQICASNCHAISSVMPASTPAPTMPPSLASLSVTCLAEFAKEPSSTRISIHC